MRHTLPIAPQFYVTAPQPCPYLEGRMERKLFTALQGDSAERLNDSLSKQGFRRSQNVLYRPSCSDCAACLSARIRVADFAPNRGQARVARRNAHLRRKASSPWATEEQYALFRDYLDSRHATGGMADMDLFEFAAMVEETPIRTRLIEYTDPAARGPGLRDDPVSRRTSTDRAGIDRAGIDRAGLRAVCLTDILDDGLSMVYSFFDPEFDKDSLGTHVILDHIAIARELNLPYVYLGYWVPGSQKMGYKAKFGPLEIYRDSQWQRLDDPEGYDAGQHPLSSDPIAEQVARIQLPDGMGR